jgi:bifunctional non-homologous end joining protein LigD
VEDGTARLRTRNGYDYTSTFPELAPIDRGFDNCIIDGEVCPVRKDGITDFSGLQAAMKAGKTAGLVFFAFDLLLRDDQDDPNRLMMVATDTRLRRENDT